MAYAQRVLFLMWREIMMLLNEPKNVAENTGRVMIHTFQPGAQCIFYDLPVVKVYDSQLIFLLIFWHNIKNK